MRIDQQSAVEMTIERRTLNLQPLAMKGTLMPNHDSFAELDAFYQQTLDYLYLKYHYVPDPLPHIPLSAQAQSEMSSYECLAASLAEELQAVGQERWQYSRDPRFSNGLPRRRLRR